MRALVTGGAGFIGSHIVDRLLQEATPTVCFDNLSTGRKSNLRNAMEHPGFSFFQNDVQDFSALQKAMEGVDTVFHFQANADVRGGVRNTRVDLEQNTLATWNVLEACRVSGIRTFVFASSAVVYGEPEKIPTPETEPLFQTSLYGASKAACEGMIQAYSNYFGFRALIFRFVSWIGPRYSHGVIADFVGKLRSNPSSLEVLGDGRQTKSYLDVRDGIEGIFAALRGFKGQAGIFNVGHRDLLPVRDLAGIVLSELGICDCMLRFTGGERGWPGDSPVVHLDTARLEALGWKPHISIEEGIRSTVRDLVSAPAA